MLAPVKIPESKTLLVRLPSVSNRAKSSGVAVSTISDISSFERKLPKFSTAWWTTSAGTWMSHWLEVEDADMASLKAGSLWQSQQRRYKVFIHFWMSFLAPSASDAFLCLLYLCVPLSCHDRNSVVEPFFMVLLFGSLSMNHTKFGAIYLIPFRCRSICSSILVEFCCDLCQMRLLFHSRFLYLARCTLFCCIVQVFCCVLCSILVHIFVRNRWLAQRFVQLARRGMLVHIHVRERHERRASWDVREQI